MRAAVILFPGSNADAEMIHTLRNVVGVPTDVVWHKESELPPNTDLVAIPGGFSYGDYLRVGALAKTSPIVGALRRHADRGGLTLGVCNGFQVLTETGLLPGALVLNEHRRFECRDIWLRTCATGPFTAGIPEVLRIPIAHADGRYHVDADTLAQLVNEERVAFRYCSEDGAVCGEANPNGSIDEIAGVYGGIGRNILGLMPHPERASEPLLGTADGRALFDAAIRSLSSRRTA
jgi:phosphoribosylformylglycinamidine synthase